MEVFQIFCFLKIFLATDIPVPLLYEMVLQTHCEKNTEKTTSQYLNSILTTNTGYKGSNSIMKLESVFVKHYTPNYACP